MKRLSIYFSLALTLLAVVFQDAAARQWRVDDVPDVQLADSARYVSDPDDIVPADVEARMNSRLAALRRATSAEVAVVALSDIDPSLDIDTYATRLFNKWGIGKSDKDNGILILLSRDSREATIRTGKGAEGVFPDIIAGRVIRNEMIPRFKEGDYAGGLEAAVGQIELVLTDPKAAAEIRSQEADRRGGGQRGESGAGSLFSGYLTLAAVAGVVMLLVVLWRLFRTRKEDPVTRYRSLDRLSMPALFLSFLGLALPLPAYLLLKWQMRRLRTRPHICPRCHKPMVRLGEEEDNRYLQPWQDTEERINSVDYDVWLCQTCGDTDIIPYVNKSSAYTQCPQCHARAMSMLSDRTVKAPTPLTEGRGIKTYSCRHCGYRNDVAYSIPKIVVVAPVGGSGRGGGFGGGGFGGGGFGGGSSMGGGATGRW